MCGRVVRDEAAVSLLVAQYVAAASLASPPVPLCGAWLYHECTRAAAEPPSPVPVFIFNFFYAVRV